MASCEPKRTKAYDADIRWRVVYQLMFLELPVKAISQNLCVDVSTVQRTLKLFKSTGFVDKRPYPSHHGLQRRKLKEADQDLILELVIKQPGNILVN